MKKLLLKLTIVSSLVLVCSFGHAQTESGNSETEIKTEQQELVPAVIFSDIDLTEPIDNGNHDREDNWDDNDCDSGGCYVELDGCGEFCLDFLFEPTGLVCEAIVGVICLVLGEDAW